MTKKQRIRQLERRKNLAGCAVMGIMAVSALLFVNAMGSTGDKIPDVPETEIVMTQPVEPETETEIILAAVEAPIVEEPNEWEEFEVEETEVVEVEQKDVPTTTKKNKYSKDDLERLAHLIWCEAGGSSKSDIKAMQYTGSVVLNRVNSKLFPNTIKGVIAEKNQYGVASYYMKKKPSKKAYEIAKDLLENGSKLPSDYFLQAGSKTFQKYGNKKKYIKVGKIYFSALKK